MARMTTKQGQPFDRLMFESVMKRRFFYTESFEIYRVSRRWNEACDNKGLYDYGPPGCALQANIVEAWRRHFVLEENMLELDCSVITPEPVLKTSGERSQGISVVLYMCMTNPRSCLSLAYSAEQSIILSMLTDFLRTGHVDKFADWMCKDPLNGDYLRADHLVEKVLEARLEAGSNPSTKLDGASTAEYTDILAKIDGYDGEQLGELIKRLDIRNPATNGEVLPPVPFNLM